MNLAQIRTAVRTRLGVPEGDTFFTDQALTDLVNEALAAISSEADWPWLQGSTTFTTTAGDSEYDTPADWAQTRSLCIDGYNPMDWIPLTEIRGYQSTEQGVPCAYTVSGDDLILRPAPNGTYTVIHDYIKEETTLVTDADVPYMPSGFRYSVVAYATHLAFVRAGDVQRATAAMADYAGWKNRMMAQRRRQRGGLRVRVRPGGAF